MIKRKRIEVPYIRTVRDPNVKVLQIETPSSGTGTDHTHSNKTVLDKLSVNLAGNLTFNGNEISATLPDCLPPCLTQEDW